jgi:hypothetical protein
MYNKCNTQQRGGAAKKQFNKTGDMNDINNLFVGWWKMRRKTFGNVLS